MALEQEAREQAVQDTNAHIRQVALYIGKMVEELQRRGLSHDRSKLEQPELDLFAEWGPKLKELEYGSDEYKAALEQMGVALKHHYENNRHHPEFHREGIAGMTLIDVLEMVCDWQAATKRMKDGDFSKSLEINRKRFGLSDQLVRIIANTAEMFEEK